MEILILYKETFPEKILAARREKEIEGWSKAKRKRLITKFSR
jgi:predicted GIY-YIG superfamily endonuclease